MDVDRAKQQIREEVWAKLDRANVVLPPGARGRIPSFVGAELAAQRLAALTAWRNAQSIKSNPDKAQLSVRRRALAEGKLLYMAVPKLANVKPFYLLDPANLPAAPAEMATGTGAAAHASRVTMSEMSPVDLVVCGSVAVNHNGTRVGKGAGYSDIEVALLTQAGLIDESTVIVTTVHQLQVVDGPLPESAHDFSVDLIVTPDEVIECSPPRRPSGIYWERLSPTKITTIPVLAAARTSPHRDWKYRMRRGQATVQLGYNDLVESSRLIRHFETAYVPGLLQTADYARRVLAEMVDLHSLKVQDVDQAVMVRLQRQQHIYNGGKRFEFLLAEPVLRWMLCPPHVMLAQLDRLQTAMDLPNVKFGIVPMGVPLSTTPQNAFQMYDDVAIVETFIGETAHREDEATAYAQAMERLWDQAVTGEDARRLILLAAEDVRQQRA